MKVKKPEDEILQKEILVALKKLKGWCTTNSIAIEVNNSFYKVERELYNMLEKNPPLIVIDQKPDQTYWRVQNG